MNSRYVEIVIILDWMEWSFKENLRGACGIFLLTCIVTNRYNVVVIDRAVLFGL